MRPGGWPFLERQQHVSLCLTGLRREHSAKKARRCLLGVVGVEEGRGAELEKLLSALHGNHAARNIPHEQVSVTRIGICTCEGAERAGDPFHAPLLYLNNVPLLRVLVRTLLSSEKGPVERGRGE